MRRYKTIATVTIIIPLLMLSACMKNYGRLAIDTQVKRDFQAGVIQPDLQYYYAGRENMPMPSSATIAPIPYLRGIGSALPRNRISSAK
jgi:hypothetical protein